MGEALSAVFVVPKVFLILVIFYLFLLVKWDLVRRPLIFWAGMGSNVLSILWSFFLLSTGESARTMFTLYTVFSILTVLLSLACAVGAVYRGQLPASMQKAMDQVQPPK
ncbi:MAG: hypothetical protein NTV86_12830 [Planctomycetota bacterium]|nr:hypothetical protein [Planctomycetota bacterium]